jgi:hypothetical protein
LILTPGRGPILNRACADADRAWLPRRHRAIPLPHPMLLPTILCRPPDDAEHAKPQKDAACAHSPIAGFPLAPFWDRHFHAAIRNNKKTGKPRSLRFLVRGTEAPIRRRSRRQVRARNLLASPACRFRRLWGPPTPNDQSRSNRPPHSRRLRNRPG